MTAPTPRRATLPLYLVSAALSTFGNASIAVVLPWLVLARTGDPALTGMVAAAAAAPAVAAALVGGYLIDRVGQRRMSVLADVGSATAVAGLAVVDRLQGLDVTWFVVLGVLGALFDVPGMTARETMMARVSSTSGVTVDRVAGLRQAVSGVSFLLGPALAGLLLAGLDPISAVWVTAACSAGAAACTLVMPLTPASVHDAAEQEMGGFATVRRSSQLRAVLLIAFGGALVGPPMVSVLLPAHFSRLGHPEWFGLTMSMFAVGSIVGALAYPALSARSRWRSFSGSVLLVTAGMAAFATLDGFWVVAAGTVVVGLGSGLMSPVFMVFFSEQIAESVRGRVLGLFDALTMLATPIGLGATSLVLSSTDLHGGALAVLVAWLVVAAYSLTSRPMRTFAESGGRPRIQEDPVIALH
jgi:MFS family permease